MSGGVDLHVGEGLERVLGDVLLERGYQDAEHGGPWNDDRLTDAEWCALLTKHLGRAAGLVLPDRGVWDADAYRQTLVRVAALALAAVESLDRKTGGGER